MKSFIIIIFLLLSSSAYATLYEDAEDNQTKRWILYDGISNSVIKNIYDLDKESRVISFNSQDNHNGYMLEMERNSTAWCNTKGKIIKWEMSTERDFVILISVQTESGHRYIIYTSSDRNGRGYYGLGADSVDGEWHQFSRDLNLDLKRYEPSNQIVAVDSFFVRGSIKIDNIEIVDVDKIGFTPKKVKDCRVKIEKVETSKPNKLNIYDDKPPVITLVGASIIYIELGGEYIEEGATAIDNVDGAINVEISESIDTHRVGVYTLFYFAKDEVGNSSITTRIINVGDTREIYIKTCKEENSTIERESVKDRTIIEVIKDDNYKES
jgi:hypothetical protein